MGLAEHLLSEIAALPDATAEEAREAVELAQKTRDEILPLLQAESGGGNT